jgi:hypothetical protein
VDGAGYSWTEGGCENGEKRFSKGRRLTDEEQRAVREAFATLPPPDGKDCDWSDRFVLRVPGGAERLWYVCGREGNHPNPLEIEGLPQPFFGVASALKRPLAT